MSRLRSFFAGSRAPPPAPQDDAEIARLLLRGDGVEKAWRQHDMDTRTDQFFQHAAHLEHGEVQPPP